VPLKSSRRATRILTIIFILFLGLICYLHLGPREAISIFTPTFTKNGSNLIMGIRYEFDYLGFMNEISKDKPSGLYQVSKDGTNVTQLSEGSRVTFFIPEYLFNSSSIPEYRIDRWPRHSELLLASKRDWLVSHDVIQKEENVYQFKLVSTKNQKESKTLSINVGSSTNNQGVFHPALSPDGTNVIFVSPILPSQGAVFRYDIQSKMITKLATVNSTFIQWPNYSPDGRKNTYCFSWS